MESDEVVRLCSFVIHMCSGFKVGAVNGAAVRIFLGENRWPSKSGYFDLAGKKVRFFTCSTNGICSALFTYRL